MVENDGGKGRFSLGNAYVSTPLGLAVVPRFERSCGGGEISETGQHDSEQRRHDD
jgi:hypothetical protein